MNDHESNDLSQLRPGPIRNKSLSPELLDQIKVAFDVIGKYLGMPLEEFEIGFMRDLHPEREVALWIRITKAWLAYHEDFLANETLPNEEERELLGALLAISTGVKDISKLNVPDEVGRRLIRWLRRFPVGILGQNDERRVPINLERLLGWKFLYHRVQLTVLDVQGSNHC